MIHCRGCDKPRWCRSRVGFEYVETTVVIAIGRGGTHAGLLASVFVDRNRGRESDLFKGAVAFIVKKDSWRRIAGNVKIGPALVIEIAGEDTEAKIVARRFYASFARYIFEMSMVVVVIQAHDFAIEAARTASYRNTFPVTATLLAGTRVVGGVEST
ncbi:MAG TPA: hypothetical protein VKX25_15825 [Bryobacteraceae bacterium]|jgi:hypothetical protein|nr:hypothetical protein [Bryobacteraceae bacterium]